MILWHNPRCSKSRQALALLEEAGVAVELRRYLDKPPSLDELRAARDALGPPTIAMMRTGEPEFRAAGLSKDAGDDVLLAAMAEHPKLIERPVAFHHGSAVIGRPPERVLEIL